MVGVPALQHILILVREKREIKFKDLSVHLVGQIETGKLCMFVSKYHSFLGSSVCWSSLLFQEPVVFPAARAFLVAET